MKLVTKGETITLEGLDQNTIEILHHAVSEDMKKIINHYEEEIAVMEACVMNSPVRPLTELKLKELHKEYANVLATLSKVLLVLKNQAC